MGLTVISSPNNRLRSAGEHSIIEVQSDNYIDSPGTKSKLEIGFSNKALDGDEITIHFADHILVFTARDAFINDGYDWPTDILGLTSYIDFIAATIINNPLIIENFKVYRLGNYLYLEAKEIGSALNFTVDSLYHDSMYGADVMNKTDGSDTDYFDFHGADLKLFSGYAGQAYSAIMSGTPFFTSRKLLNQDGKVSFDLKKFADSFLSKHIQYPEFHNIIFRPNHLAQIVAVVSESKGLPVTPSSAVSVFHRAFVHGGLSYEAESYYKNSNGSPYPIYDSAVSIQQLPFLTHQPGNKKVFFEQIEKLFYFCYHSYTNIYLKVKIKKTDGTFVGAYTAASFPNVKSNSMFEVVVSPYRLNLTNYVNLEEIDSYEVWLQEQGGSHISETKTFHLRNDYFPKKRQFIFLTSRGGFDTILCTGERGFSQEIERELFEVMAYPEHTSNDSEIDVLQNLEEQKYNISTGWISDETNEWLRDFALARIIFEVDDDGQFFRIHMTSKKVFKRKDNEFLYKMDFEYSRSYKDEFHTPYEYLPLYEAVLHKPFPKPIAYPNLQDVVGVIFNDSDDYRNKKWQGEDMVLGQRFLILDPTSLMGDVKVFEVADGGSFSSAWSVAFDVGGNDYTISLESCPGNRLYSAFDNTIYQVDQNGVWMKTTIVSTAVQAADRVTVIGKTFDNVEIDIYGALLKDGDYQLLGTVTPEIFRSTGFIFTNNSNFTYVKAVTRHCLFVYDESIQTQITT